MEKKTGGLLHRATLCVLSMASVILIITAISLNFNIRLQNEPATSGKSGENPPQSSETLPSEQPATVYLGKYLVREHNGKIAVFEDGAAEPFLVLDVTVASLPKTDAALIRRGITVDNMAALQRLLEDYES